jgi:hypothetical protein
VKKNNIIFKILNNGNKMKKVAKILIKSITKITILNRVRVITKFLSKMEKKN